MEGWNEFKVQSSVKHFHENDLRFLKAGNLLLRVSITVWLVEGQCCVSLPCLSNPDIESRRNVYDDVIMSHSAHKYAASLCVCLELFILSPFLFISSYIFFHWRYTTHTVCVFYSPLSGFSLLAYEVT